MTSFLERAKKKEDANNVSRAEQLITLDLPPPALPNPVRDMLLYLVFNRYFLVGDLGLVFTRVLL